jgi:hypothetical protein
MFRLKMDINTTTNIITSITKSKGMQMILVPQMLVKEMTRLKKIRQRLCQVFHLALDPQGR